MKFKRVALVHDWLFHMRGGEKVLEAIAELFPEADIYTLFLKRNELSPSLQSRNIHTSWLNRLPGIQKYYRWLLPLLPYVISRLPLKNYDLVISSSHCVAKGAPVKKPTRHICYCHTPARYAWYFEEEYFSRHHPILKKMIKSFLKRFRDWDLKTSKGVDAFIANSLNISKKIHSVYGREARVIHPPLDLDRFQLGRGRQDYYLIVSALVPYKRIDLAVEAFNQNGKPLWIVGKGEEEMKLRSQANENIRFLGWVSDQEINQLYGSAQALIFPGEEDFGIVPLEAQASGTPVIAYAGGGALETVKAGETGILFNKQTVSALSGAIREFEKKEFKVERLRQNAEGFSKERFQKEFLSALNQISS